MRGSSSVASLLEYTLNFILKDVRRIHASANIVTDKLLDIDTNDVLIACGFARQSKITMQVVNYVKKQNIPVLGITDDPLSPLALASNRCLFVTMDSQAFIQSYTAAFSIIHGLLAALGARNKDFALERLNKLENALAQFDVFIDDSKWE